MPNFDPYQNQVANQTVTYGDVQEWMTARQANPASEPAPSNLKFGPAAFIIPIVQALFQQAMNDRATDKQNAYNSPSAQMSRLRSAGINPYSAASVIAGNNQSAPRQAAQVNLQNAIGNFMQLYQMQAMNEDLRGKRLQNDILANNLQYSDKFNQKRLENLSWDVANNGLRNAYLSGQISYQEYVNTSARLKSQFDSWVIKRGDSDLSLFKILEAYGFEDLPDEIPLSVALKALSSVRSGIAAKYDWDMLDTNKAMTLKKKEFLDKQYDFLEEQLRHAMTINDKTERWFAVNQIMSMLAQIAGIVSQGFGMARTYDLIQHNPLAIQ